ncbi:MAG TPA: hypothetical protein PLQ35_11845 [bacterium]|nr:hypothetical protein [bacterium]HQL62977.1 hypothetical protein [bacterium]
MKKTSQWLPRRAGLEKRTVPAWMTVILLLMLNAIWYTETVVR